MSSVLGVELRGLTYPRGPGGGGRGGQRFMLHLGGGRYHVVEGVQITADLVTREEAEALVSRSTH